MTQVAVSLLVGVGGGLLAMELWGWASPAAKWLVWALTLPLDREWRTTRREELAAIVDRCDGSRRLTGLVVVVWTATCVVREDLVAQRGRSARRYIGERHRPRLVRATIFVASLAFIGIAADPLSSFLEVSYLQGVGYVIAFIVDLFGICVVFCLCMLVLLVLLSALFHAISRLVGVVESIRASDAPNR